ncbi:MAG: glycosyltransferase family 2 protein [Bacteroidota bacterium]
MPLLSILTPVYNREAYIGEAIESVQQQGITDWEMVIVDDASTDNTVNIVKACQAKDNRIRLIEKAQNSGISATRNRGLEVISGKYIVMLDSDDVCLPNRFERQVDFLEQHLQIGVLGAWAKHIGSSNRQFTPEKKDGELRARSLYRCPFVHSSTMVRSEVVQQHNLRYNESYPAANDYHFWVNILPHTQVHNLQEYLVGYRTHPQNISLTHQSTQQQLRAKTSHLAFQLLLNWELPIEVHQIFFRLLAYDQLAEGDLPLLENTFETCLAKLAQYPEIDSHYLRPILYKKFMDAFQIADTPTFVRAGFVRRQRAWRVLPFRQYAGTYLRLLGKEFLRTSRRR